MWSSGRPGLFGLSRRLRHCVHRVYSAELRLSRSLRAACMALIASLESIASRRRDVATPPLDLQKTPRRPQELLLGNQPLQHPRAFINTGLNLLADPPRFFGSNC